MTTKYFRVKSTFENLWGSYCYKTVVVHVKAVFSIGKYKFTPHFKHIFIVMPIESSIMWPQYSHPRRVLKTAGSEYGRRSYPLLVSYFAFRIRPSGPGKTSMIRPPRQAVEVIFESNIITKSPILLFLI